MASIVREAVIDAPAARCWDAVRAFDALHKRLARGFVIGLTMTGDRERTITFFTGATATERLIGVHEASMRLAYNRHRRPAERLALQRHRPGDPAGRGPGSERETLVG